MIKLLCYLSLVLTVISCGDNLPPRKPPSAPDAAVSTGAMGEPIGTPTEVTTSDLREVYIPGYYRADAWRQKRMSDWSYFYDDEPAGAYITTSPPRVYGTFHAIRQNDFVDFPGDCSFDMVGYYTNMPDIGPPFLIGPQTVWRSAQGYCVCDGWTQTLPALAFAWYQTRPENNWMYETSSFDMCGYHWSSQGTVTPL